MRPSTKKVLKDNIASTIQSIDTQIDELLAEISLVREKQSYHDEELEDLYWEASSLKGRMHNVAETYPLE